MATERGWQGLLKASHASDDKRCRRSTHRQQSKTGQLPTYVVDILSAQEGGRVKTIFDTKPPRPAGHVLVANRSWLIVQEPAHHNGALAPEHFSL